MVRYTGEICDSATGVAHIPHDVEMVSSHCQIRIRHSRISTLIVIDDATFIVKLSTRNWMLRSDIAPVLSHMVHALNNSAAHFMPCNICSGACLCSLLSLESPVTES
jgi:hypothetical protein